MTTQNGKLFFILAVCDVLKRLFFRPAKPIYKTMHPTVYYYREVDVHTDGPCSAAFV